MTPTAVETPPVIYDYTPKEAPIILRVPNPNVFCRDELHLSGEAIIVGCSTVLTFDGSSKCFIILPLKSSKLLERHELAHCNGWTHSKDLSP